MTLPQPTAQLHRGEDPAIERPFVEVSRYMVGGYLAIQRIIPPYSNETQGIDLPERGLVELWVPESRAQSPAASFQASKADLQALAAILTELSEKVSS